MLKTRFVRSYKKADGKGGVRTVFVYEVTGNDEAIAQYKKIQGDKYRESDTGVALHFSTRHIGDNGSLIITSTNKIVADTSAYDKAASLSSQFGGNLGAEIAKMAAAQLMNGNPTPAPVAVNEGADLTK